MDYLLCQHLPRELVDIIVFKVHKLNLIKLHEELVFKYKFKTVLDDIKFLKKHYDVLKTKLKYTFPDFHNYFFGFSIMQAAEIDFTMKYNKQREYNEGYDLMGKSYFRINDVIDNF